MAVANNADDYTKGRLNIFFPGVVPSLDGQCVSLVKWFMAEMSKVPSPQAARGDARYVGKTLVAQGHATEVPYSQRRRGDIICYEYGTYGHIAVQLSGGRVFEQNVNIGGVSRRLIRDGNDSWYVYASRIGSENESFRQNPHVYRLKTYSEKVDKPKEKVVMVDKQVSDALYLFYLGQATSEWGKANAVGKMTAQQLQNHLLSSDAYKKKQEAAKNGTLQPVNHLPYLLRSVYKPAGAKDLPPGLYQVK